MFFFKLTSGHLKGFIKKIGKQLTSVSVIDEVGVFSVALMHGSGNSRRFDV